MKYVFLLLSLAAVQSSRGQTDTLYYDPPSGNYIVRYIGVTLDDRDTLITFTYEPPTKIDPIIECFVTAAADGKYLYRYKITNGPQAQQNLNEFSLHCDSTVSVESRTPETSWRNRGRRMRDYSDPQNPKTVFTWVWRGDQGLEAGWTIDSCILVSDGLPSLANSYSQAVRHILVWPADQKDNTSINIEARLGRVEAYPNANVYRKTIGPMLPATPFVRASFLDTLISYKHQALALGWIDDAGVANSLDQKLDNARKQLVQGNNKAAKNTLEAFVNEVEAQKGKHLSSEAYALLKYNAEYLIQRLQ